MHLILKNTFCFKEKGGKWERKCDSSNLQGVVKKKKIKWTPNDDQ